MSTQIDNELEAFRTFIESKLQNGGDSLSPEECLREWRDSLVAIREGLEDVKAGRVQPLDEFDQEFRTRYNIPPDG